MNGASAELISSAQADLSAARMAQNPEEEAEALLTMAFLLLEMDQKAGAIQMIRAELRLRRRLGNLADLAQTLSCLSRHLAEAGRLSSAIRCLRAALAISVQLPDASEVFLARANLGDLLWEQGRHQEAKCVFEEALPLAPSRHFQGRGRVLESLSLLAEWMGFLEEAIRRQHDYGQELLALGQDLLAGESLVRLGRLHAQKGEIWQARELFGEAAAILDSQGDPARVESVLALKRAWTEKPRPGVSSLLKDLRTGHSH